MDSHLAELAAAYGVATEYWDQSGGHHVVSQSTVKGVLNGFGVDVTTEAAVLQALGAHRLTDWRRMLPPVFVQRQGREGACWVHVPAGAPAQLSLQLAGSTESIFLNQIDDWTEPMEVDGELIGQASFSLPIDIPLGWHTLTAESSRDQATCPLVITPERLPTPPKAWGLMTQLYSVRSAESWGIGDLHDLSELARWIGQDWDADFLLVNPMHAAEVVPPLEPSPYLPATRRFVNPLYLHIEDIEESDRLSATDAADVAQLALEAGQGEINGELLERDKIWQAKLVALRRIHAVPLSPQRQQRYESYQQEQGPALQDFAAWCVLTQTYGPHWREWPATLQDCSSSAVTEFRASHRAELGFYVWLQWLADEQIAASQSVAIESGLRLGIIHDLAVGVHGDGADAWRLADALAADVTVGAPPDMYNQLGQDWAQPPWNPRALADQAYLPFRDILRSVLRHAGGIRIDHILGLFRQWWIPAGNAAHDGTYVSVDHEALLGILVLEAQRVGAVVIGEDLGTVQDWIKDDLADRGVLGTGVLWFERDEDGHIKAPESWRSNALASVTVHDLPPSEGYVIGAHVELRHRLGLLSNSLAQEQVTHEHELAAWKQLLVERGWLASDVATPRDVVVGLHLLLASSPARLLAVSLPDLVGDRAPQNQPGTNREYPNWCVPLADVAGNPIAMEDLPAVVEERMITPIRDRAD